MFLSLIMRGQEVGINITNPEYSLDVRSNSIENAAQLNISNQDKSRYIRLFSGSMTYPDPSISIPPEKSLLFASFNDTSSVFNEYMRISSIGNVGIGINNPQAMLDVKGGDWNLEAGNPGDFRIGDETYNFRIGVATGGGGAGITRLYTNSNALFLGVNNSASLILEPNGSIIAPSVSDSLIDIAGNKALITKEYAEANFTSSGLESLDEGNGVGWRIKGANPNNYGNIGENAADLSFSSSASSIRGATGNNATATGLRTTASGTASFASGDYTFATGNTSTALGNGTFADGSSSTAMGALTEASGFTATAMGNQTIASGQSSVAMGSFTKAMGSYSISMGYGTEALSHGEIAVGTWNELYTPNNAVGFDLNDRLFVVGNGILDNRSNALTILKNGTITAPSFDIAEITDAKALITKEFADANLGSTGLETLDEGNGIGWRLKGSNPSHYGPIGQHAVDFSLSEEISATYGAIGNYSIATGFITKSQGQYSTAMGRETIALGSQAVATGFKSKALGNQSTAFGHTTIAQGSHSTALGYYTTADSRNSTAIGRYNVGGGSTTSWVDSDPLFEIGIGTTTVNKRNALTVLKNGNVGIGTSNPSERLAINATGTSEKAIYSEAIGLYGKGIHVKVTSTHSSANAILAESGGGSSYAGYFLGRVHVAGVLSKSSGSFKIDHPLDPENKYLSHSFVESPDMMNIYNGNITTDVDGNAIVELPEYFEALNMEFRYQLTVIGEFAQAIIGEEIVGNTFKIRTDKPNVRVSWQVTGVRNDKFAQTNRIPTVEMKEPSNRGKYLNAAAFGQSVEMQIGVSEVTGHEASTGTHDIKE